jgi:hypothetical protein
VDEIRSAMLIARSSAECRLYIELHPCECGAAWRQLEHSLDYAEDSLIAVYQGSCEKCGRARRFEFELAPDISPNGKFGGDSPSRIIDAGEFLAVADAAARAVPGDVSRLGLDERRRARLLIGRAVAAMEEVLKFIPAEADRVPAESLLSAAGKEMHRAEPGRFRKPRLDAVLGAYRIIEAELS